MASNTAKRTTFPGSLRAVPRGAKLVGKSDPKPRIEITMMLRPPKKSSTGAARADALIGGRRTALLAPTQSRILRGPTRSRSRRHRQPR